MRGCRCVSVVWGQLGVSAEESCLMSAEPEALPQTNAARQSKLVDSVAEMFGCCRHTPPLERANALLTLVHGGPAPSLRRQRREGGNTGVFPLSPPCVPEQGSGAKAQPPGLELERYSSRI